MARGGAPHEIQRAQQLGRKDVTIHAPAAVLNLGRIEPGTDVSDKDLIAMQNALIRELRQEVEQQKMAAETIAVTTCALIKAICDGTGVGVSDGGDYQVEIPKSLYKHLEGSELELAGIRPDTYTPVLARIVDKSSAPHIGGLHAAL